MPHTNHSSFRDTAEAMIRLVCSRCDSPPLFRDTDGQLLCDVHQFQTSPMPAPSAICGRKRCTETEAQEQAAAARAAVADLAFVSREEVRCDVRVHQ